MKPKKKFNLNELSTEDALYFFGLLALPVNLLVVYAVVKWLIPHFKGECIFYMLWGAYCPGCGGTRALLALVHGDILMSIWYHPLIMYCVVMYLAFMGSHTLEKLHVPFVKGMKFRVWIMYGMLVILILNCILKNVLKFVFGIEMI